MRRLLKCIVCGLLLAAPSTGSAGDNLRAELSEVVRGIRSLPAADRPSVVSLDEVVYVPSDDLKIRPSAGSGVALTMAQELRKVGIQVAPTADVRIRMTYDDVLDKKSKALAARILVTMTDGKREVYNSMRGVFGDAALSAMWGATLEFPVTDDFKARSDALIEAIDKSTAPIDQSRVSPSGRSPYSMELLAREGLRYVPRLPKPVRGEAVVSVDPGEVFAVRLHNRSDQEVAVLLFVDAVPLFSFSTEEGFNQIILPPRATGLVKGWFLGGNPLLAPFEPFKYPKSESLAEFPSTKGPGVVTAVFSKCWPVDEPPPEDEPASSRVRPFSRSADQRGSDLRLQNSRIEVEEPVDPAGAKENSARLTGEGPVSSDFRSRLNEVRREYGVVRGAASIRFERRGP